MIILNKEHREICSREVTGEIQTVRLYLQLMKYNR